MTQQPEIIRIYALWSMLVLIVASEHTPSYADNAVQLGCKRLDLVLDPRLTSNVIENEWATGHERSRTV
jgi:hypothetical protein